MSEKISETLSRRLEEVGSTQPQQEIPVIVTFKDGADLTALEQNGLKIQRAFTNISAVAGTIPAAAVKALAALDQIEAIEYDDTAWAL